ncbi:MAG: hypothetical protein WCR67_03695 [Bacilli bacterium]
MKKQNLLSLILLSLLVASCNNTPSASTSDSAKDSSSTEPSVSISTEEEESTSVVTDRLTGQMLDVLRAGYSANEEITTVTKTSTSYGSSSKTEKNYLDYQVTSEGYTFQEYAKTDSGSTPNKNNLIKSGHIVNIENVANKAYLGIDNAIHYSQITDPLTTEPMIFKDSGFSNPFSIIDRSLFIKQLDNPTNYVSDTINEEQEKILTELGYSLLGTTDYKIDSFILKTENGVITSYSAEYLPLSENSVMTSISLTGSFVTKGEETNLKPVTIFPDSGNKDLEEAFLSLKNKNYKEKIEIYSINESALANKSVVYDCQVTDNILQTEVNDLTYPSNYNLTYVEKNNAISQYTKINNKYYSYLEPEEEMTLENILPSFEISSDLFTLDDDGKTYSMKKTVPAITPSTDIYNIFANHNVSDLKILVEDDSMVITNLGSNFKEVTTIYDINTSISDFSTDLVEENCDDLTWKDLLSNQSDEYNSYLEYMKSDDVINTIPTLGGTFSLATIAVDNSYREIKYHLGTDITYSNTIVMNWLNNLQNVGFGEPSINIYGGYSAYYDAGAIKINETVSVTPYMDIFYLQDTYGEIYLYIYAYISL